MSGLASRLSSYGVGASLKRALTKQPCSLRTEKVGKQAQYILGEG